MRRWRWVAVLFIGVGLALAQDDLLKVDFQYVEGNPILPRGTAAAWDGGTGLVFAPHVIQVADTYYLFYSGADNERGKPAAIGFATSTDGVTWTKYAGNPILTPDGIGYDAMCVSVGVPLVEDGQWVLYYAANSQPCYGPGRFIGRATAPTPQGPWTRSAEPVLSGENENAWDHGFIMPHAVLKTDAGYVMYYSGGIEYLVPLPRLIGMATSADGLVWAKVDDPATTEAAYAESDPLMQRNRDGSLGVLEAWSVSVLARDDGYEMFFSSTCPDLVSEHCPTFIGYGMSEDGRLWETFTEPSERVLTPADCGLGCHRLSYPFAMRRGEAYWLYFTECMEQENDCQIGLAMGTIEGS